MGALKRWILLSFVVALTSCATIQPPQPEAQNEKLSWDSRVHTLSEIQHWNLKALIAVRQQHDAWSANLQWQQQKQNYHIVLFGPLGSNSYELTGQPGKVELANAQGQHFYASSPEQLLKQQIGWEIPVSSLLYWARGLPVPNAPAEKQFDRFNHLIELRQQGWVIRYLRYVSVNNIDMPNKIFLDNPNLNVKLIISQWQL